MNKKIKCLGIAGSPRQGGNTGILLSEALAGAAEAGAETELIKLRDFRFAGCIGCDGCFKEGECVVQDDMQQIYPKLLEADRIILTAPIFSMGMNAQAKAMVDRCQRFWSTKYVLKRSVIEDAAARPPRRGLFISAAGSNLPKVFDGAEQVARYFFKMLEMDYLGSYTYKQVDEKGAIRQWPEALKEVREAGRRLAAD
jgi:multimeric flavodoxin WrbA